MNRRIELRTKPPDTESHYFAVKSNTNITKGFIFFNCRTGEAGSLFNAKVTHGPNTDLQNVAHVLICKYLPTEGYFLVGTGPT